MEVFPGGSWYLEALPGVCGAPVQQLRPGHVVLAWNADLPVAVDHKLGATVLEGCTREEGNGGKDGKVWCFSVLMSESNISKPSIYVGDVELKAGCQKQKYASWLYMAAALLGARRGIFHDMKWKQVPSPASLQWSDKAFTSAPFKTAVCAISGLFYFGLINTDENTCPWLLCCLENTSRDQTGPLSPSCLQGEEVKASLGIKFKCVIPTAALEPLT